MAITTNDLAQQMVKIKQLQVTTQEKQKIVTQAQDDVRIAQRAVTDAMSDYNILKTKKDLDDATAAAAAVPKQ